MADQTSLSQPPQLPAPEADQADNKRTQVIAAIVAVIVIGLLIACVVFLLTAPAEVTAQIRDVFIIVMAFQSLLLGFVLIILILQLARLTNLLQNELKPILLSLNETINVLKGTSTFLSDNLAEPVIKLNSYLAGLGELMGLIGLGRQSNKKPPQ
jgi:hypothetical protein